MRFAVVALLLGGCLRPPGEFRCAGGGDCGPGGTCDATGFCSFVDPSCPSGSRYGAHSGSLSNQCVGPTGDAGMDATVDPDASPDGPPATWGTPAVLAPLNTGSNESDPSLTADGLEIFFVSDRVGLGGFDIYRSTRPNLGAAFDPPVRVDELSGANNEFSPEISDDGLTIHFTSNRNQADFEVFKATRADRASLFTGVAVDNELTSNNSNITIGFSRDLLVAVVCRELGGALERELFVHTRASVSNAWGSGTALATLNTGDNDVAASLDLTGLEIVLHSDRGAANNVFDLYTSKRASLGDTFPAATPITELNTAAGESNAYISGDARRMVFARDNNGARDLFETTR